MGRPREADAGRPRFTKIVLTVDTIPEATKEFATQLQLFAQNRTSSPKFLNICTGFRVLLQFLQAQRDLELDVRLDAVEEKLRLGKFARRG